MIKLKKLKQLLGKECIVIFKDKFRFKDRFIGLKYAKDKILLIFEDYGEVVTDVIEEILELDTKK